MGSYEKLSKKVFKVFMKVKKYCQKRTAFLAIFSFLITENRLFVFQII